MGQTGAGKSTMLDAITFGLFGKPFRKINKPQLLNSINEKACVVEVEFIIGKKHILVRRGIKPNIFEIEVDKVLIEPAICCVIDIAEVLQSGKPLFPNCYCFSCNYKIKFRLENY